MKTGKLFDLKDKVAIVSGGYGLYGKHISTGLCEAGATVVIASRNAQKCAELANAKLGCFLQGINGTLIAGYGVIDREIVRHQRMHAVHGDELFGQRVVRGMMVDARADDAAQFLAVEQATIGLFDRGS